MRTVSLLVAITLPALALAAGKTKPAVIEQLLAQNVAALAKGDADDKLGLAKGAVLAVPGGVELDPDMGIRTIAQAYYAGVGGAMKHKLGKATLAIDDAKGIAYFQAPFNVAIRWLDESGGVGDSFKGIERIGGIAVRDGARWQLGAVMYSRHLDSDKKVIDRAENARDTKFPDGEPTLRGDENLGAIVRGWFKTGFAAAAATTGTRIASGTGPTEFQTNTRAVKLAKQWDKLGLGVSSIEVTPLAGGAIAFVQASTVWPSKKRKVNVPMMLGMVIVPVGSGWRWVSMQFSPE